MTYRRGLDLVVQWLTGAPNGSQLLKRRGRAPLDERIARLFPRAVRHAKRKRKPSTRERA